jgi:hypothetical protein
MGARKRRQRDAVSFCVAPNDTLQGLFLSVSLPSACLSATSVAKHLKDNTINEVKDAFEKSF